MKVLKNLKMIVVLTLFLMAGGAIAQNPLVNTILPPDHLLENLPWLGDDGKIESRGLFDFEDFRGLGPKDVILIYRQSAPVAELDKPHNQTLAVCFFDTPSQKYIKALEDEGGLVQWVKLLKVPDWKSPILVALRDDLKGHQVIRGYTCVNNQIRRVLDAQSLQVFAQFTGGAQSGNILVSAKALPKDSGSAEHVFSWDKAKNLFVETGYKGAAGWEGDSILLPTPTAIPPSKPVLAKNPPAAVGNHSATIWWNVPFDANKTFLRLKTELVPQLIQKNQIMALGQKANAFFKEAQKNGVKGKDFAAMRSGYYTAVSSTLLDMKRTKDAAFYLKIALSYQTDNAEALALKGKMPDK
jgi:hypothetical protein